MLFNSFEYAVFLPIVLLLYWLSPHNIQNRILLVASYLFYGVWDIRFLFLIILSTSVDYLIGLLVDNNHVSKIQLLKSTGYILISAVVCLVISWPSPALLTTASIDFLSNISIQNHGLQFISALVIVWITGGTIVVKFLKNVPVVSRKKIFLTTSICSNLIILGFFKYFNFFIDSAETIVSHLGGNVELLHLDIVLPIGISFYTFQTISYSIDIYKGKIKSTDHFFDFALFVAFFPQLVAGPIERASNLLPRILQERKADFDVIRRGLFLIFWGLFKKVAIADGVAASVNSVYNTTGAVSFLDVTLATILFAIQIYCDFSAYSDIARGTSKLLGIELMRNFNLPYFSTNPSEFWRRWHISLSSWLRDYLYIPLGGSKGTQTNTYRNLMITMLLGGFWHGAAWNFILWGAYQGLILSIHRYFTVGKEISSSSGPMKIAKIAFFFAITCYGWLLFRATSFAQILDFTSILLFGWDDLTLNIKRPTLGAVLAIPVLVLFEISEYRANNSLFYSRLLRPVAGGAIAIILLLTVMGLSNEPSQFIYFQF